MKYIPILFSTPMVQAILANSKSQTRRIINIEELKKEPDRFQYLGSSIQIEIPRLAKPYDERIYHAWELKNSNMSQWVTDSCKPNDVLWVRETWMHAPHNFPQEPFKYKASVSKQFIEEWPKSWSPSIHMPKEACRLFLQVDDIRVERLHDITEHEAVSEGIQSFRAVPGDGPPETVYKHYLKNKWGPSPIHSYQTLWDSINGHDVKKAWNANPWVWVIRFHQVERPADFLQPKHLTPKAYNNTK